MFPVQQASIPASIAFDIGQLTGQTDDISTAEHSYRAKCRNLKQWILACSNKQWTLKQWSKPAASFVCRSCGHGGAPLSARGKGPTFLGAAGVSCPLTFLSAMQN